MANLPGGKHPVHGSENSQEIQDLGKFAVDEYNSKQNGTLCFRRVVKAETQVVSGTVYYLTIEATDGAGTEAKLYEAKVWVKPWENYKSLESFSPVIQPEVK